MKTHGATTSARCTAQGKTLWETVQFCFVAPVTHFASQARTTSLEKAPKEFLVGSARHRGTHNIPRQHLSVRQVAPAEPRNVRSWKVNRGILSVRFGKQGKSCHSSSASLACLWHWSDRRTRSVDVSILCPKAPQMILYQPGMETLRK